MFKRKRGRSSRTQSTTANYEYEFAGRKYLGDRVSLHSGSDNVGTFQRDVYNELERHHAQQRSQGTSLTIEVQAIRLGACAMVGVPVEPFAAIGAQVKALSPFATTFFSGYTNGVEMYLPTADAYPEGYEVWMTPFAPEAAGLTVEESLALLSELR